MGAPSTWLEEPLARFRAIVEGTYTAGGIMLSAPGTFKSTRLHGDLADPEFPAAHFHRGYEVLPLASGRMDPETAQSHCGPVRRSARVSLRIGYAFGKDHPLAHSAGVTSLGVALELAHGDHEKLEYVLSHPRNWSGCTPTVCAILRKPGDVVSEVLDPLGRVLVSAEYDVLVSYQAGTIR